jgi:hypothetical protein
VVLPAVKLHRVFDAARHPRKEWAPGNVRRVQRALRAHSILVPVTGIYDHDTRVGYVRWQRSKGYTGHAADGLPGVRSLTLLGASHFRVLP